MAGKRKFNPNRAKIHRAYSVDEVARLYSVHKATVRNWFKAGLKAFTSKRPHLIHGADLRAFHTSRREALRQRCRPGELYCLRCRRPQRPAGDMLDYIPITLLSGNFRGICPECDGFIHRRVGLASVDAARGDCAVEYPHGQQRLSDMPSPSPDCDLQDESCTHGKTQ
jgi:hypothetical protein